MAVAVNMNAVGSSQVITAANAAANVAATFVKLANVTLSQRGLFLLTGTVGGEDMTGFKLSRAASPGGVHVDIKTDAECNTLDDLILHATGTNLYQTANGSSFQIELNWEIGAELGIWAKNTGGAGTVALEIQFQQPGVASRATINSGAIAGSFGGALSCVGNFSVNTNKFTVTAANGNAAVAGTLAVTGATTLTGAVTFTAGIADATNVVIGTTTGTQFGTGVTQKLGFWGATPIVQPAGATQAALTDSTGGAVSTTLAAITAGAAYAQADLTAVKNAIASLNALLAAVRTALLNAGIIKGAA